MASTTDVFHLFRQLQTMESSFLSILVESVLRMESSLSNANVFLVVETSDGTRKIAGSDSICQRFVDDSLVHSDGDVRVRLNADVNSMIVEEPMKVGMQQQQRQQQQRELAAQQSCGQPYSTRIVESSSSSSSRKRLSTTTTSAESATAAFLESTETKKSKYSSSQPSLDDDSHHHWGGNRSTSPEMPEAAAAAAAVSSSASIDFFADELPPTKVEEITIVEDSGEEELLEDDGFDGFSSFVDHRDSFYHHVVVDDIANNHHHRRRRRNDSSLILASNVDDDGVENISSSERNFVEDYLRSSLKVSALLSRNASDILVDKNSVDVKILSSVAYEMGKEAAAHVKVLSMSDPGTKAILRFCFDSLWSHIPWLERASQDGNRIGKRSKSLRVYLREQMYLSIRQHIRGK